MNLSISELDCIVSSLIEYKKTLNGYGLKKGDGTDVIEEIEGILATVREEVREKNNWRKAFIYLEKL